MTDCAKTNHLHSILQL